jgi:phasin family protein
MFTEFFRNFSDWSAIDPSKFTSGFDMESNMGKHKRHVESATTAQHLIMSNMQALLKRQAEILQDNTARLLDCYKKVSNLNNPEKVMEEHTNFIKETMSNNLANTRELAEMATKAQMEVLDYVGNEISENLSECCKHPKKK